MSAPTPYLFFGGSARAALTSYQEVFGGDLNLLTFAELGRTDGPDDAIGHGALDGPVSLFAADAAEGEQAPPVAGLMLALLGAAEPAVLERWFAALADGGEVTDPLQLRPWGDHDGQVVDRFGVRWLVGYSGANDAS